MWSSCSPDFGARSVVDRFAQIEPKVLLAVDGYRYGGRDFDRRDVVRRCRRRCRPGATVVLGYLDAEPRSAAPRRDGLGRRSTAGDEPLEFERVPFDHPLWVLYSSGTTGLPKAIVQGQGGILLEHLKMLHLHVDAQAGDRLFWFTTTGWMMWNFLVSGPAHRRDDRALRRQPGLPGPGRAVGLRRSDAGMTTFGTSASYIARVHEGGRRAGAPGATCRALRGGRLDRLAALARGLPLGLRARRGRHVAVLDVRRHRPVHGVRRRRADCCRSTRASCRRARSAPRSRRGTRTASR